MSLIKNIGLGKKVFDFRYNIDNFRDFGDLHAIWEDWKKKGIWPTDEECIRAIEDAYPLDAHSYLDYNYDSLCIRVRYYIKSFDKVVVRYITMAVIRRNRISINPLAGKYVERLKTFGYEVAFRSEQNYYIMYGPR